MYLGYAIGYFFRLNAMGVLLEKEFAIEGVIIISAAQNSGIDAPDVPI